MKKYIIMKKIYEFNRGDEITRIAPSKKYQSGLRDRSYMGDKLIFVGIANGQIYCQRTNKSELSIFGDKLINLSLDMWDEDWDYYFDPNKLLEGLGNQIDKEIIEDEIKNAIEKENYELVIKLKQSLKN